MAVVSLSKGNRVDLTKGTGLKKAMLGLGWDTNRYQGSEDFDLDLVLFECDANDHIVGNERFIFYNNLTDPEKAVKHSGDNRTGEGDGDDETAHIEFSKINPGVSKILIGVTIFEANARHQNFGMVDNAFIRIVDDETGEEKWRYDLGEEFSTQTSVIFGEIYKQGTDWKFRAVGDGYMKELVDFCHEYGVDV